MTTPLAVYIAAPFQMQDEAKALRSLLKANRLNCTSSWLDAPENIEDEWARRDLEDIARCDVLVAINPAAWALRGTGGRHVEFGYALALCKPIVLLGPKTNIFHHLKRVTDCSVEEVAMTVRQAWLRSVRESNPRAIVG